MFGNDGKLIQTVAKCLDVAFMLCACRPRLSRLRAVGLSRRARFTVPAMVPRVTALPRRLPSFGRGVRSSHSSAWRRHGCANAGTVYVRKSKIGKSRHVTLTPEGAEFFLRICAGRGGNELMFHHADGSRW